MIISSSPQLAQRSLYLPQGSKGESPCLKAFRDTSVTDCAPLDEVAA